MIKIYVWTSDMTSRSYFGKMNSSLGSVVPLAMFFIYFPPGWKRSSSSTGQSPGSEHQAGDGYSQDCAGEAIILPMLLFAILIHITLQCFKCQYMNIWFSEGKRPSPPGGKSLRGEVRWRDWRRRGGRGRGWVARRRGHWWQGWVQVEKRIWRS